MRTEGHKLLLASGKTQAEVAEGTGRSAPTVWRWFNDGRPDTDSQLALKQLLGIPMEAWRSTARQRRSKRNGRAA